MNLFILLLGIDVSVCSLEDPGFYLMAVFEFYKSPILI